MPIQGTQKSPDLDDEPPRKLLLEPTPAESWVLFKAVVEDLRQALDRNRAVVCATAQHSDKGWAVSCFVRKDVLRSARTRLLDLAKKVLLEAAKRSGTVIIIGYLTQPFSPMPLGFGAELTERPADDAVICKSTYQSGVCSAGQEHCDAQHPKTRVGLHVMLKPARQAAPQNPGS